MKNYRFFILLLIAFTKKEPMGTVYSTIEALKNAMAGNNPITTTEGMLKPIGGGRGRQTKFTILIPVALRDIPKNVQRINDSVPLPPSSDLPVNLFPK